MVEAREHQLIELPRDPTRNRRLAPLLNEGGEPLGGELRGEGGLSQNELTQQHSIAKGGKGSVFACVRT